MIRLLIDFRFAVHYGLDSDIARGPKSADFGLGRATFMTDIQTRLRSFAVRP
jgi:hypothetical protein